MIHDLNQKIHVFRAEDLLILNIHWSTRRFWIQNMFPGSFVLNWYIRLAMFRKNVSRNGKCLHRVVLSWCSPTTIINPIRQATSTPLAQNAHVTHTHTHTPAETPCAPAPQCTQADRHQRIHKRVQYRPKWNEMDVTFQIDCKASRINKSRTVLPVSG